MIPEYIPEEVSMSEQYCAVYNTFNHMDLSRQIDLMLEQFVVDHMQFSTCYCEHVLFFSVLIIYSVRKGGEDK